MDIHAKMNNIQSSTNYSSLNDQLNNKNGKMESEKCTSQKVVGGPIVEGVVPLKPYQDNGLQLTRHASG